MFLFGPKVDTISPEEAKQEIKKGAVMIDIRNEDAFKLGHINKAINIPIKNLPLKIGTLDKKKEYLVICYVGGSSKMAASMLKKAGFNVKNVSGGMQGWGSI
ncbi:rhodanese-related sulfurtransferase [Acetoanaerobium pronyense]|uniref:Rhodanese-related sulfurtransferase n=1 Tax=Acetoanaerobium pronyense TaxID=1482736 RepID=A0ABS4KKE2_9FIRM|nr:rhodanese-like domain-containing protein [Acetoanaerobium pronyense]MBP2028263.1 rhodanese-related sulfurtransferase [Acetoanaerobium pronyense]